MPAGRAAVMIQRDRFPSSRSGGNAMSQGTDVFADLAAEGDALGAIMNGLDASQWALKTPAPGWTIKHQVAHMASIFHIAGLAGSDPDAFVAMTAGADKDFDAAVFALLTPYLA